MDGWTRLAGALIVTYFVSRLALIALRRWRGNLAYLLAAHLGTAIVLVLLVGVAKSHGYRTFALSAAYIYVVAQCVWFAVDYVRGIAKAAAPPRHRHIREEPSD
jgi:hypothetical protein